MTGDIAELLAPLLGTTWPTEINARPALVSAGLTPLQITVVLKSIAVYDADAEPIKAKKGGGYEADADQRDQETTRQPTATSP